MIRIKKSIVNKIKKVNNSILVILSILLIFLIVDKIRLTSSNEDFIKNMLNDSNYYEKYEYKNILGKLLNFINGINLNEPVSILSNSIIVETSDEIYNPYKLESVSKYVEEEPKDIVEPVVYIYNSHQLENYDNSDYQAYNITPNVMMASYLLKDKLKELNIESVVEENNITEFMKLNNMNYNSSYLASRNFIDEKISMYKSLKYFIDIHRDSVKKEYSTVTMDDKQYAKVLFVVGLEHENYSKNLELVTKINEKIKVKYPNLTRGILTKKGSNVNGIYNQDISPNAILIELGGYENKISEVENTIELLATVLKEIINES